MGGGPIGEEKTGPRAKAPRERLILLHIEASRCPALFGEVLSIVTEGGFVPVDIELRDDGRALTIDILLDRLASPPTRRLLRQLQSLAAMKWAEFRDHQGRAIPACSAAD